jgi:hypothetical protein
MKHIVIIVLSLVFILGVGFWTLNQVSHSAYILLSQSQRIEENINKHLWDASKESLNNLKSTWKKAKAIWTILLNHTEIDNIDLAIVRIEQFINARETGLALAEISSLKLLFKHIPEKEKLTLENIF